MSVWNAGLLAALKAVRELGYTVDGDLTAFPSGVAIDRQEVIDAIRNLRETK